MADQQERILTVGELREELRAWPDDAEITFGNTLAGDALVFYRFKNRSGHGKHDRLQIELNEVHRPRPR